MDEPLHDRLAARADELPLALDEGARLEGDVWVLTSGWQVFTKGVRRGFALLGEERVPLAELAARVLELGPDEAAMWCEDWLGFETEPEVKPRVIEPAAGAGGFLAVADRMVSYPTVLPHVSENVGEPTPDEMQAAEPEPERRIVPVNGAGPKWTPPESHKLLPQSEAAEKGVICSFMLSPYAVAKVCEETGMEAGQFHLPQHRILFEALTYLVGEKLLPGDGSDFIPVTEYLHGAKLLDAVGGPAAVTELFRFIGTAANVRAYIATVQEKYRLRELIQLGTRMAARAYDEQDNGPGLMADVMEGMARIEAGRGRKAWAVLLGERVFDVERPPEEPHAVFTLAGCVIATAENFVMVQAKVKAGKSAFIGAMLASMMEPTGDTLGVTSSNPEGKAVIHFDTEQSKFHHHMVIRRALTRAGRRMPPPWLFSYYVKGLGVAELMGLLRAEMERRAAECGGILAVFLDGIGDFCADVNDPEMSFALVAELERLGVQYQCVFVLVLHENPGSDIGKTRGHLGSHLERKAETNLRMEKDGDGVTVVYSDRARTAHIPKEKGVKFAWDEEAKMHLTTDAPFRATQKGERVPGVRINARITKAKVSMGRFFARGATVRKSLAVVALTAKAAGVKPLSERAVDYYWQELRDAGLIAEDKAIRGLWSATDMWARELEGDYPTEATE